MAIRSLNLDSMFAPIQAAEIDFNLFKFSGGETSIKLNKGIDYNQIDRVVISHRINSAEGIIEIAMAKDALSQKGIPSFDLIIPYIPYARQDSVCAEGEAFSLKVFSTMINAMNFLNVICLDPHSDVSKALINNISVVRPNMYIINSLLEIGNHDTIIISPDSGANKKIHGIVQDIQRSALFGDVVSCDKIRDRQTGLLSGFQVFKDDLEGKPCLIVDDICDGGGTFVGLGKELKAKNAGPLYLYVSHGIFSKGFDDLALYFDKIFVTNSFKDIDNPLVKQFKLAF